jgi:hypothetical protein
MGEEISGFKKQRRNEDLLCNAQVALALVFASSAVDIPGVNRGARFLSHHNTSASDKGVGVSCS